MGFAEDLECWIETSHYEFVARSSADYAMINKSIILLLKEKGMSDSQIVESLSHRFEDVLDSVCHLGHAGKAVRDRIKDAKFEDLEKFLEEGMEELYKKKKRLIGMSSCDFKLIEESDQSVVNKSVILKLIEELDQAVINKFVILLLKEKGMSDSQILEKLSDRFEDAIKELRQRGILEVMDMTVQTWVKSVAIEAMQKYLKENKDVVC